MHNHSDEGLVLGMMTLNTSPSMAVLNHVGAITVHVPMNVAVKGLQESGCL